MLGEKPNLKEKYEYSSNEMSNKKSKNFNSKSPKHKK